MDLVGSSNGIKQSAWMKTRRSFPGGHTIMDDVLVAVLSRLDQHNFVLWLALGIGEHLGRQRSTSYQGFLGFTRAKPSMSAVQ